MQSLLKGNKRKIESFNGKKAPGIDGITIGIFLRTFHKFPRLVTTIYNQCFKRGRIPRRWKAAKIIPITKPGKENSMDPSKYRPISLFNIGGKVLEKLLINRINHHLYKNEVLIEWIYAAEEHNGRSYGGKKIHCLEVRKKECCYNDQPRRQRSL